MITMQMFWPNVTVEEYEALRKSVNWEGNIPHGAILHVSSFDADGIHVNDIWQTEQDFNNFVQKRLMPGVQKLGITSQPNVAIRPLHAVFNPGLKPAGV